MVGGRNIYLTLQQGEGLEGASMPAPRQTPPSPPLATPMFHTYSLNHSHIFPHLSDSGQRRCRRRYDGPRLRPGLVPAGRRAQPALQAHGAVRKVRGEVGTWGCTTGEEGGGHMGWSAVEDMIT